MDAGMYETSSGGYLSSLSGAVDVGVGIVGDKEYVLRFVLSFEIRFYLCCGDIRWS
jgi:hypothetical protein